MRSPKRKIIKLPQGVSDSPNRTPKAGEDPAKYKESKIAWQINSIDFEGEWGINYISRVKIDDFDDLIDLLSDNLPSKLTDHLFENNHRYFKSVGAFLESYLNKSDENISLEDLKNILTKFKKVYFFEEIYPKLGHFERKTWKEVERETFGRRSKSKHHNISVSKLSKKAQRRLEELNLDDYGELFSLRLSGTFRIFGIREYNYLRILWFDHDHEVCPSLKS